MTDQSKPLSKSPELSTFILQCPTAAGRRMDKPPIIRCKGVIPVLTKRSLLELLETEDALKAG